jgi:hypothetical protein
MEMNAGSNTLSTKVVDEREAYIKRNYYNKIPDIHELPITVVNKVLYSNWKEQ